MEKIWHTYVIGYGKVLNKRIRSYSFFVYDIITIEVIIMNTRKSMKLPIIITFLFICIIVYLFMNLEQTVVVCEKENIYDSDITLKETVTANLDGKKITSLSIVKNVTLPEKFNKQEQTLTGIKNSLEYTIEYLGDDASCFVTENHVIANIDVSNNELVLLDNISFVDNNGEVGVIIDTNTKSSNVVPLKVGDNYTDGEFMMYLKNKGYSCK